jgi:hypothetical protein
MRTVTLALLLLALGASAASGQGSLSTQGFGYPPGQLSSRTAATGGALAEIDPLSPVNPASLLTWGRSGLYVQYSPEYRRVDSPEGENKTTTVRFPLVEGALSVGERTTFGLSASTFLDRSWQTERTGFDHVGADSVQFSETFRSTGAVNDIRLAGAYLISPAILVGLGGHVFTGENRLQVSRTFTDTTFASFSEFSTISYSGTGVSGGVQWRPGNTLVFSMSGRVGGTVKSFRNDTTLSSAKIPKRFGAGVSFGGISGLLLAANVDWEGWSSLNALGAGDVRASDSWDYGVGIEGQGPRILRASLPVRLGFRRRTLPNGVTGSEVKENTFSLGTGFVLARGHSRADFTIQRANRSASGGLSEHAWILNFGFLVRP